jgi:type IX secretion system PorP/SprF family membrane protein
MRIYLALILTIVLLPLRGQDLPDLSNYQHNWLIFNPAFTGSRDVLSVSLFSQDKAILHPEILPAPKYLQVSAHTPFTKSPNNAVGFSYFNEKRPGYGIGGLNFQEAVPLVRHNMAAYYSHRIKLNNGAQLSLGISAILAVEKADNSALDLRHSNDPQFMTDLEPVVNANFSAGVLYYTENTFAGFSIPRLVAPITVLDNNNYTIEEIDTASIDNGMLDIGPVISTYNLILSAGRKFGTGEITYYPNFLINYIPEAGILNTNYMLSMNVGIMNEKFWLGTIYKSSQTIAFNMNFEIFDGKGLIGLSWDFPLRRTIGYFDNAFEIVFRYDNLVKVVTKAPYYF